MCARTGVAQRCYAARSSRSMVGRRVSCDIYRSHSQYRGLFVHIVSRLRSRPARRSSIVHCKGQPAHTRPGNNAGQQAGPPTIQRYGARDRRSSSSPALEGIASLDVVVHCCCHCGRNHCRCHMSATRMRVFSPADHTRIASTRIAFIKCIY
jgi:hypothetical protein